MRCWLLLAGLAALGGCAAPGAGRPSAESPPRPAAAAPAAGPPTPSTGVVPEPAPSLERGLALGIHQRALAYRARSMHDLAVDACERGLARDPSYAPLHNTLGVLEIERGHPDRAIAAFREAVALDPTMFEAQMNLAALHLQLRAYGRAEEGYRRAIAIRPTDYDAHLGRAVALRGPLRPTDMELAAAVVLVEAELDAARWIDPERPDAYYNGGVLAQELKGWVPGRATWARQEAETSFRTFLMKAKGKPGYAAAIERAADRLSAVTPMGLRLLPIAPPPATAPAGTAPPPGSVAP